MNSKDFYYDVEYRSVRRHRRTGEILSEHWISHGQYASLEEAREDNPPVDEQQRIIKRYYEIVYTIPAQE